MALNNIRNWVRAKKKENPEKKSEMRSESPERAVVADINTSDAGWDLDLAALAIQRAERNSEDPEKIRELKQMYSRRQHELVAEALESHAGEKGYTFDSIYGLQNLHRLIRRNPYVEAVDRDQYAQLWQKMERHALSLFKNKIVSEKSIYGLQQLREKIDSFPFELSLAGDEAHRAFDDAAIDIFSSLIQNSNSVYDLQTLRGRIDPFPFTNTGLRTNVDRFLEERARDLFTGLMNREDTVSGLSLLYERVNRFPFKDKNSKTLLSVAIDERAVSRFKKLSSANKHQSEHRVLAARAKSFPFASPEVQAALLTELQQKISS